MEIENVRFTPENQKRIENYFSKKRVGEIKKGVQAMRYTLMEKVTLLGQMLILGEPTRVYIIKKMVIKAIQSVIQIAKIRRPNIIVPAPT